MEKTRKYFSLAVVYCVVLLGLIVTAYSGSRAVTTISQNTDIIRQNCIIIDAGHGGVDGGAVSCTGMYESHINLQIAIRLNDLMHLLGIHTKMIRTTDISIYTSGESIAAKKASDLKERVRIVNETENGILLSIHQNHYSDERYSGAQMFYAKTQGSQELAKMLQTQFCAAIDSKNHRQIKPVKGLYLMEHIVNTGVLVECGFLSNPEEEAKLRDEKYQKKLCCVIASVCSMYLSSDDKTS